MADKYLMELDRVVSETEKILGLCICRDDGVAYRDAGIDDVINFCAKERDRLPSESVRALNASVGRKVVTLSYINSRLKFFDKKKISVADFPCMRELADVVLLFVKKKSINDDALVKMDKCIIIMQAFEEKQTDAMSDLTYRLIRLFVVLVLYGMMCNASVVADLLLSQVIVK